MISITVPLRIPSQNEWNNKRNPWIYRKHRNEWFAHMRKELLPQYCCCLFANVQIVSYRSILLDEGNLIGGAKMIPDNLIRLGYMHDDNREWCKITYDQIKCRRAEERTTITITYGKGT